MRLHDLDLAQQRLHAEATRLAGGLTDLGQRATVYHHLFKASGGNHVFPLIAAHGALWAGNYFRFWLRMGRAFAWQYFYSPTVRAEKLRQLDAFANAFRDINRRVCVDTYRSYHLTADFGDHPEIRHHVPADLLDVLLRVHAARRAGVPLSDDAKREVFLAHFLNEQEHVVGPAISKAVAAFDWPLVRNIAIRPMIRFAYFPGGQRLWFRNFSVRDERIEKGLLAFKAARDVGWSVTESTLDKYEVLDHELFVDPFAHFAGLRERVLA